MSDDVMVFMMSGVLWFGLNDLVWMHGRRAMEGLEGTVFILLIT